MRKKETADRGKAESAGGKWAGQATLSPPYPTPKWHACQQLTAALDAVLAAEEEHAELALHYARLMLEHAAARDAARRLRASLEQFIPEVRNERN